MIHKDYDDDDQGYKLLGTEQERYTIRLSFTDLGATKY